MRDWRSDDKGAVWAETKLAVRKPKIKKILKKITVNLFAETILKLNPNRKAGASHLFL